MQGHNNSEKTFTSDFDKTMDNVLSFIIHRWTDFNGRELQLVDQLKRLSLVLEEREERLARKNNMKRNGKAKNIKN